jgi:hypothetical protein
MGNVLVTGEYIGRQFHEGLLRAGVAEIPLGACLGLGRSLARVSGIIPERDDTPPEFRRKLRRDAISESWNG